MRIRLSQALEEHRGHLAARGMAANTLRGYTQLGRLMLQSWGDLEVTSITPLHIDRFFANRGYKANTQNQYLSQMRSFFKWCRSRRYIGRDIDPTEAWRSRPVPINTDHVRLPLEDFPRLLDAADHPRDRAVMALGLFTFMRGSEISTLRIGDLDLGENTLKITRHKTRDTDVLPVSLELHEEMVRWLNWYRKDQGRLEEHWFLVPAKYPHVWAQDKVTHRLYRVEGVDAHVKPLRMETHPYRCTKRALKALGYPDLGEGAHTLRRSGARQLADHLRSQGYDGALLRVASMLGHRDTKVTERYIGWGLERTQRNEMIAGKRMFEIPAGEVVSLDGYRDSQVV